MYALSLGVARISDTLPLPVYALLSGLNAATVGVIAFAGVQLADKAITDQLTRLIVVLSACAGVCYSALWYFPTLILISGIIALGWDMRGRSAVGKMKAKWNRRKAGGPVTTADVPGTEMDDIAMVSRDPHQENIQVSRRSVKGESGTSVHKISGSALPQPISKEPTRRTIPQPERQLYGISFRVGVVIIIAFFGEHISFHSA
jgi:hypothetical protein